MATIHCKSCGRVYVYEKNGTCPRCGAYNRPPRKEIVEADGTVRYVTTEQKVCYEEEECYEEEVRQGSSSYHYTPAASVHSKRKRDVDNIADKLRQKGKATSAQKKSATIVVIISALISVAATIIGNVADRRSAIPAPAAEPWESVAVEPATEVHNLVAHEGNEIHTEYGSVTINSCYVKEDVLHLDLCCDDINNLTVMGYYETPTDSDFLKMEQAFSSGNLYTYLASLPEEIRAEDCAVVLDVPVESTYSGDIVSRYWIWPEQPTYEVGDDFTLCGQRLFVSEFRQAGNAVDVSIDCEWDILDCCEATLTVLNVNGQPYTTYLESAQCHINLTDGRNTATLNFTLRNKDDTAQSITLLDTGNQRQVTINLQ